jgi:hypothetical protein
MKRVLLLVCLILSIAKLDLERERIYLLSSIASFVLLFGSELMCHRNVQNPTTERPFLTGASVSSKKSVDENHQSRNCRPFTHFTYLWYRTRVVYSNARHDQQDRFEPQKRLLSKQPIARNTLFIGEGHERSSRKSADAAGKDSWHELKEGSEVMVHSTERGVKDSANVEVDMVGDAGIKRTEGTIKEIVWERSSLSNLPMQKTAE